MKLIGESTYQLQKKSPIGAISLMITGARLVTCLFLKFTIGEISKPFDSCHFERTGCVAIETSKKR